MNRKALEIALTIAIMVNAAAVNETHVMRKVVIDGSTPSGFQRTAIIALDGEVTIRGKRVPIQTVCVEEDACRKTEEKETAVYYRMDRLGAPLVEVVTAPVITSPEEAEEVALTLGRILRTTRRVKRGIGTIRQDLNISIGGGALIEVKGVQKLDLISKVAEFEVQRQQILLEIRDQLKERGVNPEDFAADAQDVTEVFKNSKSRLMERTIKRGEKVMALVLPNLSGLLNIELMPGVRFGSELSDYAKFWGKVAGIFHTDELPAFGITQEEVTILRSYLMTGERDAIVLVAAKKMDSINALRAVADRAKFAIVGVPSETRGANPDGTTHYSRPRPGAARMYPETDVPPVSITAKLLQKIEVNLPEPPEAKLAHLLSEYCLNKKLAMQVLNSDYYDLFEAVARKTTVPASFVAATLTETFKDMERRGIDVDLLAEHTIEAIFTLVDSGEIAKEAIPEVITWMVEHKTTRLDDAVETLGLKMVSESIEAAIVDKVVRENVTLIQERGIGALGALMGIIMKEMRGRIDAKRVSQILKVKVNELTKK